MTTRPYNRSRSWIRRSDVVIWPALAAGLSPLWLDWFQHGFEQPWAAYSIVFLPVAAWAAFSAPRTRPRSWALVGIVLALAIELAALTFGAPQRGRLALPLAWISGCLAFGAAPAPVALIAVWWVPVPSLVFKLTSPAFEHLQIGMLTSLLSMLGLDISHDASWVLAGGKRLGVTRFHSGWNVLALATGLGWWVAGSGRARWSPVRCMLVALALGATVHLGGLSLAFGALSSLGPERAAAFMTHAWLVAGVAGVPLAIWAMHETEPGLVS